MAWTSGLTDAEKNELFQYLRRYPAIPALRCLSDVDEASRLGAKLVFFLTGTIFDLRDVCARAECLGMYVFCHVDLVQGIGKDNAGMEWLATEIGLRGILSTRSALIKAAKGVGLMGIQRLFLLDSESLRTGIEVITSSRPDAVEILPALVVPSMASRLPIHKLSPFIAGGLVETLPEMEAVLAAGALGVSTSKKSLWGYERKV